MTLLEVDGVTHSYASTGLRPVLDNINLEVDTKEIVAIVGESGCGKTTLGKLITGLVRPSGGHIRFDGRDIWSLKGDDFKSWRRAVQMVHQDPYASLNPGLTIGSMLGRALLNHRLVDRRHLEERLLALLRQVGLDATPSFLRRYPHQLSGGQRQRAALARAVSLQPRLVVADEVTSMLDVSMRVAILDLLLSFREQLGITYIFISHDFGVVRYFTQGGRVVVMFYGVVVEEGPSEDVIAHPGHPYTYVLLQAIPIPDPILAQARGEYELAESPEGEPASEGCVFSNRCPFAENVCYEARPPLIELRSGHRAACFFPERVPAVSHLREERASDDETSGSSDDENGSCDTSPVAPGASRKSIQGERGG